MNRDERIMQIVDLNIKEAHDLMMKYVNENNNNMAVSYKAIYDALNFLRQDIINQMNIDDIINGKEVIL